jgi:phage shock protein E
MLKQFSLVLMLAVTTHTTWAETVWLDVRSTLEYSMGHIEGAVHLPHTDVTEQASTLLPNKDDEILVYCRSGGRAGKAEAMLSKMGYSNVKNIGGLADAEKLKGL